MPVFVVLENWTDQSIRNVVESPKRAKWTYDIVKKAGGSMELFYTMRKYDFVAVVEVPKERTLWQLICP